MPQSDTTGDVRGLDAVPHCAGAAPPTPRGIRGELADYKVEACMSGPKRTALGDHQPPLLDGSPIHSKSAPRSCAHRSALSVE
jgi:hypothetical protein